MLGKVYNLSGETLERLNGTPTTPADGDNVPAVTAPENVPASPAENIKKSFETAYGDIMTVAK